LAFSPNGKILVTGGGHPNGKSRLWEVATRKPIGILDEAVTYARFAFSPDGKRLAGGNLSGEIAVWDVDTQKQLLKVKDDYDGVMAVQFSADGQVLLTAGHRRLMLREPNTLEARLTVEAHEDCHDASLSSDGKLIATVGAYNTRPGPGAGEFKIWSASTGKLLFRLDRPDTPISAIAFSPDGKKLAIGNYYDGEIQLWNVETLLSKGEANKGQ